MSTDIDRFFADYPASRRLFDHLDAAVRGEGDVDVRVTRSQISYRRRRAFAWIWVPGRYLAGSQAPLVLTVSLPRRDPSTRWKEVVEPRPGRFTHHLELRSVEEIDEEVVEWLREAPQACG